LGREGNNSLKAACATQQHKNYEENIWKTKIATLKRGGGKMSGGKKKEGEFLGQGGGRGNLRHWETGRKNGVA